MICVNEMSRLLEDGYLTEITEQAKQSPAYGGLLNIYTTDHNWKERFCVLFQNFLIEFENENCIKVIRMIILETYQACRMEISNIKDIQNWNVFYLCDISQKTIPHDRMYGAPDEVSCCDWVQAINNSSYALLKSMKDELEYRNNHLMTVIESERHTKWKLEEFAEEQRKELEALRKEIPAMISKKVNEALKINETSPDNDEIQKIKKIQTAFRALICRRRWHNIVQDYIRSPHAESMRKRNQLVFRMVQSEEEYVECLSILVSAFYRPCKMAASSSSRLITHDEVNSIFLNSETLMFLHQIFLKGLQTRMENWPKLVLGDLFDMLLPMLSIYQEYVRNHHFSLQTLTQCKQRSGFRKLLKTLEEKPSTRKLSLENFLTFPMHRIPNYIAIIQKLLELTPFDHVERVALEHSQSVLEELSMVMHDEISETENIRKNLSIERLFVDGCEFLLDSNDVFIREGILIQITTDHTSNAGLLNRKKSTEKRVENPRHCFLFSRKLLIASRVSGGKLQLIQKGIIMLDNVTLVEDIIDEDIKFINFTKASQHTALAFKLIINNLDDNISHKLIFLATSASEKVAWITDINQCRENITESYDNQTVAVESRRSLLSIRSDLSLITDSEDIKYTRALDSCRLPKIRYATIERLLSRLLDVRFLSVEYLNTFLTTHTMFTTSSLVLETIFTFYHARKQKCHQEKDANIKERSTSANTTPNPTYRRQTRSQSLWEPITHSKNLFSISSSSPIQETMTPFNISITDPQIFPETKKFQNAEKKLILTPPPKNRSEMKKKNIDSLEANSTVESSEKFLLETPGTSNHFRERRGDFSNTPSPKPLRSASLPSETVRTERSLLSPNDIQNCVFKFDSFLKSQNCVENQNSFDSNSSRPTSPRSPSRTPPTPGVIVTSPNLCKRNSSIAQAAVAFAAATAGATVSKLASPRSPGVKFRFNLTFSDESKGSVVTNRVLKILKNWVSKQPETIQRDKELRGQTEDFLLSLMQADDTVPSEKKLASSIIDSLMYEVVIRNDLPDPSSREMCGNMFLNASTLHLAEQMTFIDHILLKKIPSREFLLLSWMKDDKEEKAPNILNLITRFNMTSKLVSTEIVKQPTPILRANAIEKWAVVADMCRCLHNFNGVLAIITSFTSSAIFRLKKSWEKVSKQTRLLIEKLKVIVSTDGRFRNMREALKCCDPPCVPYLGFYLTDLVFIEERSSIVREKNMVDFAKMTMVTNVIQEIRYYQSSSYTLEKNEAIMLYLLDEKNVSNEEEIYQMSLNIEPRNTSVLNQKSKFSFHFGNNNNNANTL